MNFSALPGCLAPFGIAIESTHENAPDVGMTYSMLGLSAWIVNTSPEYACASSSSPLFSGSW